MLPKPHGMVGMVTDTLIYVRAYTCLNQFSNHPVMHHIRRQHKPRVSYVGMPRCRYLAVHLKQVPDKSKTSLLTLDESTLEPQISHSGMFQILVSLSSPVPLSPSRFSPVRFSRTERLPNRARSASSASYRQKSETCTPAGCKPDLMAFQVQLICELQLPST